MVIRVDVVEAALRARYDVDPLELRGGGGWSRSLPAGGSSTRRSPSELAAEPALTLLCGRYEGFDERVHEQLASDVVSIGPYVLSGGELAAMVVCDAVIRKLPGALGHEESALEESFSEALEGAPEYPHYTRPFDWHGHTVPEVLLSGDHARVREWRRERSRERARPESARRSFRIASLPLPLTRDGSREVALSCASRTLTEATEPTQSCPDSSTASSALSCVASPLSRRAIGSASTSRWSRASAAARRCSRAS